MKSETTILASVLALVKRGLVIAAVSCGAAWFACLGVRAAENADSTFRKTGFAFGVLPAVAYDNDLGFQYGLLTNLYWYGDGSRYPKYDHSLYLECSRYVAGTMLCRAYFDSRTALPGSRLTADLTWFNDLTMDFAGFNGRQAQYHREWEDEDDPEYKTRIYYRHARNMARLMLGVRRPFRSADKLYSQVGITAFNMDIGSVKRNKLREKVPDDQPTLYDRYVEWGVIRDHEAKGGTDAFLRGGVGIDTRDDEAFPARGVWSEVILALSPNFLSTQNSTWARLTVYHRQYFGIVPRKFVVAYRLLWQHTLGGRVPFYLLPHLTTNTLGSATSQGLGGAKTMRGMVRNRLVGAGVALCNLEARWVPINVRALGQDWGVGFNFFADMGGVTQEYDVDFSGVPKTDFETHFRGGGETLHTTVGGGLKVTLNHNFVVSADWGKALSADDGGSGLYVQMNWLF